VSDLERIRADAVIGRRAPAPDPVLAAVRERWPAVVGEAVARHAVPARVVAGALVVACSSSAWSSELSLLAPTVAARLRAELGRDLELRFEVGDVPAPADPPREPLPPPAPGAAEEAGRLAAAVGSDTLRASLERAIARTLRD
jgi:predicted nucleic acid-binding Zn ribbon protein